MDGKKGELLGTIAGCLTTGSFVPQVYSVWHHAPKPASDVSLAMFVVISIGVALWIIYGRMSRCRPIVFFNVITLALSLAVVAYKLIYG